MKWFLFFAYLFLLILTPGCSEQKGNRNIVEGLSYLDQSPVRIEIADGKIIMKEVKKPDLFDNDVIVKVKYASI